MGLCDGLPELPGSQPLAAAIPFDYNRIRSNQPSAADPNDLRPTPLRSVNSIGSASCSTDQRGEKQQLATIQRLQQHLHLFVTHFNDPAHLNQALCRASLCLSRS
jgi:hypothetical protein